MTATTPTPSHASKRLTAPVGRYTHLNANASLQVGRSIQQKYQTIAGKIGHYEAAKKLKKAGLAPTPEMACLILFGRI